jgi:hypothetical protein
MIISGVESPELHLHQRHLTQAHVPLSPVELDLLLPQHLVEVKGMFGVGGMRLHLVKVLFLSSLGLHSFDVKVGADLN